MTARLKRKITSITLSVLLREGDKICGRGLKVVGSHSQIKLNSLAFVCGSGKVGIYTQMGNKQSSPCPGQPLTKAVKQLKIDELLTASCPLSYLPISSAIALSHKFAALEIEVLL